MDFLPLPFDWLLSAALIAGAAAFFALVTFEGSFAFEGDSFDLLLPLSAFVEAGAFRFLFMLVFLVQDTH